MRTKTPPHNHDTAFADAAGAGGVSDFDDCLYQLSSTAKLVDQQQMTALGHLFNTFLTRTAADSPGDVSVQVAAARTLAADPRATGGVDRDGLALKREASQRRDAYVWLSERVAATSLMQVAGVLDMTCAQVRARVELAMVGLIGLPAFTSQARCGLAGFERYCYAARRALRLEPEDFAEYDSKVCQLRADDLPAFKRGINQIIAALTTREKRTREIRQRRTVETYYEPHGLGVLIARGPAADIALLDARLTGMARAVIRNLGQPLGVPEDHTIIDDRSLAEMKFDFLTRSRPTGTLTTQPTNTTGTAGTGNTGACDSGAAGLAGSTGTAAAGVGDVVADSTHVVGAANPAGIDIDATAGNIAAALAEIDVQCPTDSEWLRRQARITVTVPALTLLNTTEDNEDAAGVPGLVDGHPVSPDVARQLVGAGAHHTVYRILTDPVSGAVLDHEAQLYTIPERMRIALIEKWQHCTLPGCDRSAVTAEIDHIVPFNHHEPARGGPTSMGNLHPLCRKHHQMKTLNKLTVTKDPETGMLHWVLPGGHTTDVGPPDQPIGQAHAQHLLTLTRT